MEEREQNIDEILQLASTEVRGAITRHANPRTFLVDETPLAEVSSIIGKRVADTERDVYIRISQEEETPGQLKGGVAYLAVNVGTRGANLAHTATQSVHNVLSEINNSGNRIRSVFISEPRMKPSQQTS